MSSHESVSRSSIGKVTRKGMRRHFDEISKAAFVQLLIRALVIAPFFFLPGLIGKLMSGDAAPEFLKKLQEYEQFPLIMTAAVSLIIYIFLLIPMRFWARQKTRRVYYRHSSRNRKESGVYGRWLSTGLLRYFRGILWGIPFIACVVYFTVLRSVLDAPTFNAPIHWLAMLLAGNPEGDVGNVSLAWGVITGAVVLFGLLFAYRWWRDMPFEYLPVRTIGTSRTLRWSRRILKKNRKKMLGNTFVNFLLSLPAIFGFGAVLGMYTLDRVNFSLSMEMVLAQLKNLFTQPVPQMVLLELLGVFAILYLPLCIYRKCRNAALMARAIRGEVRGGGQDGNQLYTENDSAPDKEEKQPESQQEKPLEETKETEA